MTGLRPLRVAVVGAGPAGIYAADILTKASTAVEVDLFEELPVPFGLVRYGVAPDHPRIKQIILALHKVLEKGEVNLLANVKFGRDVTLADLRVYYDAVIFATGSSLDAPLDLPGVHLPGSFGAAEFVYWYDGFPDAPRTWPLEAQHVGVLGNGNVALDVARMLAKPAADLLSTDIPDNVYQALAANPVTDVHIFGRRGPAQAKFSPLELRELGQVRDVDIIVYPEDFEFDDGSLAAIESSNQTKQVVKTLTDWALIDPAAQCADRRIHLHFLQRPVEFLGTDRVTGLRTERTALVGDGSVEPTGELHDWPLEAVYRAVGYFGSALPGVPFDAERGVIPNAEGRVWSEPGEPIAGVYATGWIRRGPVGLIGSTKSDAAETVRHLLEDFATSRPATQPDRDAIGELLTGRGVEPINWADHERLERFEKELGQAAGRERIKVVDRQTMIDVSLGRAAS